MAPDVQSPAADLIEVAGTSGDPAEPAGSTAGSSGSDGEPGRSRRRSRLPILLPILALSILALVGVTYQLPYYAIAPGEAQRVDALLEVPAERAFPRTGQFLLMSVNVRDVTPVEAFRAWLDPDVEAVRVRELIGVAPTEENRRQFDADLRSSMQRSQHVAAVVAFGRLGLPLPAPGSEGGDPAIRIDTRGVSGSSGGLALTLGLLDALGSGELTGGHRVAVTGAITPDGRVGDVDGVAQKAAAARGAGARYLLVPPGGFAAATAHAGSRMEVLEVSTLDEALAALGRIGGDLGEPRPPGPTA